MSESGPKTQEWLLETIAEAFSSARQPSDDAIVEPSWDSTGEDTLRYLKGRRWQDIDPDDLAKRASFGLCHLKPLAFKYYLPAWLKCAVMHCHDTALIVPGDTRNALSPPTKGRAPKHIKIDEERLMESFERRIKPLRKGEARAILEVLKYLKQEWDPDHLFKDRTDEAIEYWANRVGGGDR